MRGVNQHTKNVVRFGVKDKDKKKPEDVLNSLPLPDGIEDLPLSGEEENKFAPQLDNVSKLALKKQLIKHYGSECLENPIVRLLIGTVPRLWFEMRRATSSDKLLKLSSELRSIFTALESLTGRQKKNGEQAPVNPLAEMSDRDLEKEIADGERILGIHPGMRRCVQNEKGEYVLAE